MSADRAPQPVIRGNDWRSQLTPPAPGSWTPTKTVSVLMLAWQPTVLEPVLAALAAQTYPADLMEVLVVDDGNTPALELPEIRPAHTRIVRVSDGWGCANGVETAVAASTGEILVRLDDDMLVFADHIENHARWHHLIDHAVVLGTKRFVDPDLALTPAQVRDAVADGSIATLHDWDTSQPHAWVEDLWRQSDDLTTAGFGAFRCVVGATLSVTRAMYDSSDGLDRRLRTGEDTVLGHHLAEAGAVFIPDHEARSWHLGLSHAMQDPDLVNQYNAPAFADQLPSMRGKRQRRGRVYQVPYVEVVVSVSDVLADEAYADLPTREGALARVQRCVDSVLDSDLDDLRVLLVGEWDRLGDERVSPLRDPLRALRILHRGYEHEPRVRLVREDDPVLRERSGSPMRLVLGSADVALVAPTVRAITGDLERTHHGLRVFRGDDGQVVARLERTAAFARASWHVDPSDGPGLDAFVEAAFGARDVPAVEAGFVPSLERRVKRYSRLWLPAEDPDDSWRQARSDLRSALKPFRTPDSRADVDTAGAAPVEGPKALRGMLGRLRRS